jgi:DNA polymerase-1
MIQTLTGDRVDGYPGCPGMGPQRAAKLLLDAKTPAEAWERVLKAYEKAGQTAEVALVQARIAKILLHNDWDGKTVRLWSIDNESV